MAKKRRELLHVRPYHTRDYVFYKTDFGYYRYDIDKKHFVALKKVSEDPEQWQAIRVRVSSNLANAYEPERKSKYEPTADKAVEAITCGFAIEKGTL